MDKFDLARTMRDFYAGEYDVLICSAIIQNGIDMPNVNTIVIDHAERFGLSQLHQLRGRVGRGKEQAYCALLYRGYGPLFESVVKSAAYKNVHN